MGVERPSVGLLSVGALAYSIERFLRMRRDRLIPAGLADRCRALWSAGDYDAVIAEAKKTNSSLGKAIAITLVWSVVATVIIAYEPVWAIGTGKTATPEQAQAVHAALRAQLRRDAHDAGGIPLLYGGSVSPVNAKALFAQGDIDGALVGSGSLKAADFAAICDAASVPTQR